MKTSELVSKCTQTLLEGRRAALAAQPDQIKENLSPLLRGVVNSLRKQVREICEPFVGAEELNDIEVVFIARTLKRRIESTINETSTEGENTSDEEPLIDALFKTEKHFAGSVDQRLISELDDQHTHYSDRDVATAALKLAAKRRSDSEKRRTTQSKIFWGDA